VLCVSIYLTVTVPALRTIVTPLEGVDTREDRVEAMRVLSAGNVMIMGGLGAILVLQVRDDCVRGKKSSTFEYNRQDKNMRSGRR